MTLGYKLVYSIIPIGIIILFVIHMMVPGGVFNMTYFLVLNIINIVQIVLLYKEMGKRKFKRSDQVLYTFLLVMFLPFHLYLIWGIFD